MKKQNKINQNELIKSIAKRTHLKQQDIKTMLKGLNAEIVDSIQSIDAENDSVIVKIFPWLSIQGIWKEEHTKTDTMRNIGEHYTVSAHPAVRIKMSDSFKKSVAKKNYAVGDYSSDEESRTRKKRITLPPKDIQCCDCGEWFTVSAMNYTQVRCADCQHEKRKEYQRLFMREKRQKEKEQQKQNQSNTEQAEAI